MDAVKHLIEGCRQKDRKAQYGLYQHFYGYLLKVCWRYKTNKEDAQSLVNESFLKAYENINSYQDHIPFELWLRKIAINSIIDEFRKNKKHHELLELSVRNESYWESKMTTINTAEVEMNADSLRALIACLPPISRQVFNLIAIDGYDYDEVSHMLEISKATCRWHVHFSRKKLQEMLMNLGVQSKAKVV